MSRPRTTTAGRRIAAVWAGAAVLVLLTFAVGETLGLGVVTDPLPHLSAPTLPAALLGIGLLVGDLVLPVPSSVVMIALGAVFGTVWGTALAMAGHLGSLSLACWLGRRYGSRVLRLSGPERDRAERFVRRCGTAAVVLSRPVPVLSESVAVTAAAGGLGTGRLLVAGLAGALPVSGAYAAAGAYGSQASGAALAAVLIGLSAAGLWMGRRTDGPRLRSAG